MWNDARVRYDIELRRECVHFNTQRDEDLFSEKIETRFQDRTIILKTKSQRSLFFLREVRRTALSHWRKLYTRAPTANTISTLERLRKTLTVSSRTNRWRERSEGDPPRDIGNEI